MTKTPANPSARSSDAVFEQVHLAAWRMVQAGRRPTADLLVSELGGSKVTAVAALRTFWSDFLPGQVATQPGYAPDPVVQAANAVWRLATREADAHAEARISAHQDALARRETELGDQLRATVAERERLGRRVEELSASLGTAKTAAERERKTAAEQKAVADKLQRKVDSLQVLVDQERAIASTLREERQALRAELHDSQQQREAARQDLEAALARLSEMEASSRAAVDTAHTQRDQANTRADLATAELVLARDTHQRALDAERAAHTVALGDLKDAHQAVVDRLMIELDQARTERDRTAREATLERRQLERRLARAEQRVDAANQALQRVVGERSP